MFEIKNTVLIKLFNILINYFFVQCFEMNKYLNNNYLKKKQDQAIELFNYKIQNMMELYIYLLTFGIVLVIGSKDLSNESAITKACSICFSSISLDMVKVILISTLAI